MAYQVTSYYDQPFAASAQYNSVPYGQSQYDYEQMRAIAWQQYYAQQAAQQYPTQPQAQFQQYGYQMQQQQQLQQQHRPVQSIPPPPPSTTYPAPGAQPSIQTSAPPPPPPPPAAAESTLSWADRFKLAQQKAQEKAQQPVPIVRPPLPPPMNTTQMYQQPKPAAALAVPSSSSSSHFVPLPPPIQSVTQQGMVNHHNTSNSMVAAAPTSPASAGRGRGGINNRPAWMTQGSTTVTPQMSDGPAPAKKSRRWDNPMGGSAAAPTPLAAQQPNPAKMTISQ